MRSDDLDNQSSLEDPGRRDLPRKFSPWLSGIHEVVLDLIVQLPLVVHYGARLALTMVSPELTLQAA
jgi:hypothetical protein